MKVYLGLMSVIMLLALLGVAILGLRFDAFETSIIIHGLFFVSLFIFFISFGTLMFYFGSVVWRKVNRSRRDIIPGFETYLFRGFLFAIGLLLLIIINRLR